MAPRSRDASRAVRSASRQRLVAAAAELFADQGFAATRVADVARGAAMSPGNVYWHFASKEALLAAILADGFGAIDAIAVEVGDAYGPARRKLELLVDRSLALCEERSAFLVLLGGMRSRSGRALAASLGFDLPAIAARQRASLRRVFAEARSEAVVAHADPDLLVSLHLAFLDGVAILVRAEHVPPSRDALRAAALRLAGYRPLG